MPNSRLVSVIVPCYNYAEYVEEAIQSVWAQTYKNIELIIINDGSTDDTDTVIKRLLKKQKFTYLKQENKGIVATRNRCLKEATGKYTIMLDADDYLDPNYVEETVKIAEKKQADIVYTNMKFFGLENRVSNFPDFNIEELKNHNFIHVSSLLRVELAKKYKFDPYLDKRTHEDWDFFLNLCLSEASAELCRSSKLNYRIHGKGRNNGSQNQELKNSYVNVYLYIISKYENKYKDEFSYLSGKMIGEWYLAIYKHLNDHIQALKNSEQERQKLLAEKELILNSRSYILARKISKAFRLITLRR